MALGAMEWNIGSLTRGSLIVGDLWVKMGYPLLTQNLDCTRFSLSCLKWPSVKSAPIEISGTETAKGRESVRQSRN
jgi:hypothetical protein